MHLFLPLRGPLSRLAAEPQEQIEYLASLGVLPSANELALEFEDAYLPVADLLSQREHKDLWKEVTYLTNLLAEISGPGNAKFWTQDAVAAAPEWETIRKAARDCLAQLKP